MLRFFRTTSFLLVISLVGIGRAECPKGDLNGDCEVDFLDVQRLASQWLYPSGSLGDIDKLNGVEGRDFAVLAEKWSEAGIPLVINEVMPSNSLTKTDPQGQYDDWIEIYNAGAYAIDMRGMHLTDNLSEPNKWQIPTSDRTAATIPSGGYLLIWADNDATGSTGLHAGFELNADTGDEVGLFDADGVYIDPMFLTGVIRTPTRNGSFSARRRRERRTLKDTSVRLPILSSVMIEDFTMRPFPLRSLLRLRRRVSTTLLTGAALST